MACEFLLDDEKQVIGKFVAKVIKNTSDDAKAADSFTKMKK